MSHWKYPAALISAFLTLLFSQMLFASVPVPIALDAQILDSPRGGQRLTIRVSSISLPVDDGVVQVTIAGDFLDAAAVTKRVSLKTGETAVVRMPIETNPTGELSNVVIRVLRAGQTTPIVVQELFVTGVAEHARIIQPDEAQQILASRAAQDAEARAKAVADQEVRTLLARGDRPVMNRGEPAKLSAIERAWNDAVQRLAPRSETSSRLRPDCAVFNQLSPRNYDWGTLSGTMRYDDQIQYPYVQISPRAAGHTVTLQVPIEFTDGCGNYQLQSTTYSANTYGGGSFTFPQDVISFNAPPNNPGTSFTVTFLKTGTLITYPYLDMADGTLTLTDPSQFPIEYGMLHAKFTSANSPNSFWFRWNDEAMDLESQWASWPTYMYLTFRSAYDPGYTASVPGCHCQYSPGIATFGPNSSWDSRWVEAHEMGHEWDLQRSNAAIGGGPHTVCGQTDSYTAFHEGFADWHASKFETEGRDSYVQVDQYGELLPCPYGLGAGYSREGNVAAYLWDVFDSVNSSTYDNGIDTISLPLTALGTWGAYSDFPAFYNAWTNGGVFGSYQSVADSLRAPNQVDVP